MKWVLLKKNSISENSDSISETGFNSVRVLMTKVRYLNPPDDAVLLLNFILTFSDKIDYLEN